MWFVIFIANIYDKDGSSKNPAKFFYRHNPNRTWITNEFLSASNLFYWCGSTTVTNVISGCQLRRFLSNILKIKICFWAQKNFEIIFYLHLYYFYFWIIMIMHILQVFQHEHDKLIFTILPSLQCIWNYCNNAKKYWNKLSFVNN